MNIFISIFSKRKKVDNRRSLQDSGDGFEVVNFRKSKSISKNSDENGDGKLGTELTVFIAITSGPHHSHLRRAIRDTWALPCQRSASCDYRFFVDADFQKELAVRPEFYALKGENAANEDMVFRNSCSLMKEHPAKINYGNSPVVSENMKYSYKVVVEGNETEIVEDLPDYPLRRRYKIDWKVCFMRWIKEHYKRVHYYVFVEDDSFVCTENLIYQMTLLNDIQKKGERFPEFRTGTGMYDGFDDSSTIMSSGIADVFVENYPKPNFNCSKVFEKIAKNDTTFIGASGWMSWGNSWMSKIVLSSFSCFS